MKVAYLTNQYPKTSHSFIRREILAVEAAGIEVQRFTVRLPDEPLVDPQDKQELQRTESLLGSGAGTLLSALLLTALGRPLATLRAARQAIVLGRRSPRGVLVHMIYLVEACHLRRRLQQCGAEHLHIHFATNPTTVGLLCKTLGGPSFSFTVHSTASSETPETNALDVKLAACSFACAVSYHGLGQLYGMTPRSDWKRWHLIHCGVDERFLGGETTPLPTAPRFVCVARFSPEKGLFTLLEAVALLQGEWELVLVGDGPQRPEIESELQRLGIAARVRLAGWQAGEEVRKEIEGARALVIPSYVEGLPVVAMEALALGRPVVATSVGGLSELIEQGANGQLVPSGSARHLADGLAWALSDAVDPQQVAKGTQLIREQHDAEKEGARLAQLFRDVLEQPNQTGPAGR